ncbi:MAG: GntR family transcriptional regulator [Burkholderiales bacterium]|jgi:GntR family transcriptional regulator
MNVAFPSVVPMYHQIYLILKEELAGVRDPQQPLPSELELASRFKVSRITMRKALDQLVQEGLIYRRRGLGSFVKEAVTTAGSERKGLLENIIRMAGKTTVRVLSLEVVPASAAVAAALGLNAGDGVVKAVRLRSMKNDPVSHITTFVPEQFGACLQRAALAKKPMLGLLEESGIDIATASQTVTARLADTTVAGLLQIDVGSALLAVNRVVRDAEGRAVQLLHGLYRPDRYEYRMDLSRGHDGEARVWYQSDGISSDAA